MKVLSKDKNKTLRSDVPTEISDRTFIVGGAVRDILLGKEPNDIDFVVKDSNHTEMINLNFTQVGKDFPVYLKNGVEFALCRQERKSGKGYSGFKTITENVFLVDDLQRRDLTINAMAISKDGHLVDMFNGKQDLEDKILRHVSISFAEDPLRVLRLARFTARFIDFKIHESTIILANSLKDELKDIPAERIFKETEKALSEEKPSNFFRALKDIGVLDVIFPELHAMIDLKQNPKHHAEGDVFEHTMRVLDVATNLSNDTTVRFAALFHDIGKPQVFTENGTFHGHSEEELMIKSFNLIKNRLKVPNSYIDLALSVAKSHHKVHDIEKMSHKGLRRFILNDIPKTKVLLDKMILAIKSDQIGRLVSEDGPALTSEEASLVFNSGFEVINNFKYKIPDLRLNISFIEKLFEIKILKSEVGLIKEASVQQKKAFIEREMVNRIKSLIKEYAN